LNHQVTLQEIYEAKAARRKRLAALPMKERVALIEKLHELAVTMRKARMNPKNPLLAGSRK
jgi:hypothetical protein